MTVVGLAHGLTPCDGVTGGSTAQHFVVFEWLGVLEMMNRSSSRVKDSSLDVADFSVAAEVDVHEVHGVLRSPARRHGGTACQTMC